MPTSDRKRCTRSVISPSGIRVCSRSGYATFSNTDSESKSAAPWKTKPVRLRSGSMASSLMRSIRVPKSETCPASGRISPADDPQQHGLAGAAAAHDGQRRALPQGEAHAAQHLLLLEGLSNVAQLDEGRGHGAHHQKSSSKSLVRKKSETITAMATCTTVSVVERPSPSVPPLVSSPL